MALLHTRKATGGFHIYGIKSHPHPSQRGGTPGVAWARWPRVRKWPSCHRETCRMRGGTQTPIRDGPEWQQITSRMEAGSVKAWSYRRECTRVGVGEGGKVQDDLKQRDARAFKAAAAFCRSRAHKSLHWLRLWSIKSREEGSEYKTRLCSFPFRQYKRSFCYAICQPCTSNNCSPTLTYSSLAWRQMAFACFQLQSG